MVLNPLLSVKPTPTIGSRCIERSMTSLNFPWRHASGSQPFAGGENFRYVSSTKPVSTTNVSCHAIIYVYKLCRNETIEWSRWDRSIVSKGVSTLLRRHQFQEMSVVTETIKPKIDAPLRGHGPVTMGSRGIHKGIVKNEIFCYYYCYYYSTFN